MLDPYILLASPQSARARTQKPITMDSSLVPSPQNEDVCARCWVLKRSRWLQQWRHRLLVLTPTCLSFFCSQSEDECPTEQFWINTLGAVQPIDADQLEIETAERQVRIEVPDGQRDRVISAIVNARLHYIPAVAPQVHVFEPVDKVGLQERYALCNNRALGRGAFGSVWRAKCLQSGRHVAIKEIELPQSTRETMRKLVLREVSLMRQVDHPHVVCLLNYFESPRAAYLVMELLPGGDSLRRWLVGLPSSNTPLTVSTMLFRFCAWPSAV